MSATIDSILSHADAFRWLFFIGLLWIFYRWMQGEDSNGIEWRDFVSAKGIDGQYHGDLNKVWQNAGGLIGSLVLVQAAPNSYKDFTGFALVMTAYFAFVGGVAGYAAYLRSKTSQVQTKITVEPADAPPLPTKTTTVVTEPAPKQEAKP